MGRATASVGAKSKKKAPKKGEPKEKKPRVTAATVSKQVEELGNELEKQIKALKMLLEEALAPRPTLLAQSSFEDDEANGETPKAADASRFDSDLLRVLADLDRRGRHDGLVPIPEVREAFLVRGWSRRTFDDRLLQAERDFVVDLKTADDPKRLAEPELSIRERGRGHLQFVVAR
ncbi:hypothetical protein LVJ94_01810 [Pendulispora rubella]|uniref:Uncharacterized protein n=1 Tax=Pendulispora rubella TaxID=2741070 RepID=A0ABZ2L9Y6_9BACT